MGRQIGLGAQGLVSDDVTVFSPVGRQIEIDDYVRAGGFDGIVEEVELRTTKSRSFDGTLIFVGKLPG